MHICEGADLLPVPLLVTFFDKGGVCLCVVWIWSRHLIQWGLSDAL